MHVYMHFVFVAFGKMSKIFFISNIWNANSEVSFQNYNIII